LDILEKDFERLGDVVKFKEWMKPEEISAAILKYFTRPD
jgi:hypothetical protein